MEASVCLNEFSRTVATKSLSFKIFHVRKLFIEVCNPQVPKSSSHRIVHEALKVKAVRLCLQESSSNNALPVTRGAVRPPHHHLSSFVLTSAVVFFMSSAIQIHPRIMRSCHCHPAVRVVKGVVRSPPVRECVFQLHSS